MTFGTSRRIKPKEKYVRISVKEMWRNLDGSSKNIELWSYVVGFELSPRCIGHTCYTHSHGPLLGTRPQ